MQPEKKSNYVNVSLNILNSIFASKQIPIKCPRKWSETVGIKSNGEGNLVLLSIEILEQVFSNHNSPIPVSRRWLEDMGITIEKPVAPIVVEEGAFSIKPIDSFGIDVQDVEQTEEEKAESESNEPSGAVTFGSSN